MQIQHIGDGIPGGYRLACIRHDGELNPQANHRITVLRFGQSCDVFKVSRRTLYRGRHTPVRLDARGRYQAVRRSHKTRRPKGYAGAPMKPFVCDTV